MKRNALFIGVMIGAFIATPSWAQATRTWVSGVGDDANPCSRTAPCKTFAGAISKTATRGEIDALDPGGYGAVTITKAITIDGAGTMASILASGTNGVIINAAATDVITLRNLSIHGAGTGLNGVRFLAGGSLILENSQIFGFTQKGVDFAPSGAARLVVSNSSITNNTGSGIALQPGAAGTAFASLTNLILSRNGDGVRAFDRSKVMIDGSTIFSNGNGAFAQCPTAACEISIERSAVFNNTNGVATQGAVATVRLSNVGIFANSTGISAPTGTVASFGNNHNAGNTTANGAPTTTIPSQ